MRLDKKEAFELRKQGKTYTEISKLLGVSRGTLSFWFKTFDWASDISKINFTFNYSPEKLKLMREARRKQLESLYSSALEQANKEFETYKNDPLFNAGLMVYAGEGDHSVKSTQVRVANSNHQIILVFKRFIESYYSHLSPKIRVGILLYPDLNDKECLKWWTESLGIPLQQFHKPVRILGRHPTRRLRYGVASLIISSKFFKVKLLELERLALKNHAGIV